MKSDTVPNKCITEQCATNEVQCELLNHVALITINRPERSNAINLTVRETLINLFTTANIDPEVWAIVLTGTGDRAFCAGGDLKEFDEHARTAKHFNVPMSGPQRNLYEVVLETYKPTIAALNGAAFGGGFELALACDLRIAAEHATMALPEAKRGLGANFGSVLLPRLIPRAVALEMLYLGEPMSVAAGQQWGLINRIVPADQLRQEALDVANRIVRNAPLSVRRYKHIAVKTWEMPTAAALRLDVGPNPYVSEDREEGVRAYIEKRAPKWRAC